MGIIGTGLIAHAHMEMYKDIPGVTVAAACDIRPKVLEEFCNKYGIKDQYADYRQLLQRDDLDSVDVCLHNNLHAPMAIEVMKSGRHCYCEKPMAGSYADAKAMMDAAKLFGKKLHIQLSFLYGAQALDERELTLVNLCCDYAHPWSEDKDELARNHAVAEDCLKAARSLGAKSIRFDLGVHELTITDEQIAYTSKKFREYARIGAQEGFKVCFENHWGASTNFEVVQTMFEAINDENFGLLLHLGNWSDSTLEEKDQKDLAMASRAVHMHFSQPYCERADQVLKPVYDAGYQGVWATEHHSGRNEYNEVAFQLAAMKKELSRIAGGVYG